MGREKGTAPTLYPEIRQTVRPARHGSLHSAVGFVCPVRRRLALTVSTYTGLILRQGYGANLVGTVDRTYALWSSFLESPAS